MGAQTLKNIAEPMRAWRMRPDGEVVRSASEIFSRTCSAPGSSRQALDRGAAVPEHERRSGAGIFRRRHGGRHHHRAVALQVAVRDRAQFELHLQGHAPSISSRSGANSACAMCLEGSVRKAGNRVRITGQLIEAATGRHLWADKFDGALEDVFGLQDQITTSVVGLIAPTLEQAEIERAKQKPTDRLDSYDFYLRGMALAEHEIAGRGTRVFQEGFRAGPAIWRRLRHGGLDADGATVDQRRAAVGRNAMPKAIRSCASGFGGGKRRCVCAGPDPGMS